MLVEASLLLKILSLGLKPLNMVFLDLKKAGQHVSLILSKNKGLAVDPKC